MAAPKKGLSLYADLLASAGTISAAPVKYDVPKADGDEQVAKKKNAALQYQPKINRPKQPSSSASKHKFSSSTATVASFPSSGQPQAPTPRSNFQDWVGDDDEDFAYDRLKHVRGGKKNKKKKAQQARTWEWDDIYDPTHPNRHQDYKGSEEQAREVRDWKARLYYHRLKETKNFSQHASAHSDEEMGKSAPSAKKGFASAANLNFAPPTFDNDSCLPQRLDYDDEYYPSSVPSMPVHTTSDSYEPPTTFAAPSQPATTSFPANQKAIDDQDLAMKKAKAMAKIAEIKAKMHAQNAAKAGNSTPVSSTTLTESAPAQPLPPGNESGISISRAPVRYNISAPTDQSDNDLRDASMPLSGSDKMQNKHPGQKSFGHRILQKHGWEAGQGLGARGDGITTALFAQAEKRKKRADADGGGWAQPANMGKIVGGKKPKTDSSASGNEDGEESKPSEVVKLVGMCANMDLDHEIASNNLFDEIGEEMNENYGQVERIFIWRKEQGGGDDVFVKFTSVLSAVRCVNDTKKDGITFGDNEVKAIFYDTQKFENGEYE